MVGSLAPADEGRTAVLPPNFPTSMLLSVVDDVNTKELVAKELELRQQRDALRTTIQSLTTQRATLLKELRPLVNAAAKEREAVMEPLLRQKDQLHSELHRLRIESETVSQAQRTLRFVSGEAKDLRRAGEEAEMLLRDERRELERLSGAAKLDVQKDRVNKYESLMISRQAELKEKEADVQRCSELLREALERSGFASDREIRDKLRDIREEIDKVQAKIFAMRQDPSTAARRPMQSEAVDGIDKSIAETNTQLRAITAQLDDLRTNQLPQRGFSYPPIGRASLIGVGGATLRQLQIDFGVALCIDAMPTGEGIVVGGEEGMASCIAAIESIVEQGSQQQDNTRVMVPMRQELKRDFIGERGVNINAMERGSGARIKFTDQGLELTGSEEQVGQAKILVEEFMQEYHVGELRFDPQIASVLIGRGGSVIRKVEMESGVRSVKISNGIAFIAGREPAVKKAISMYEALLQEAKVRQEHAESLTIHLKDRRSSARVIGTKGATIRSIEEQSGARLVCRDNTIVIRGSKEQINHAKGLVEDQEVNEVSIPVEANMHPFLTARIVDPEVTHDEALADVMEDTDVPTEEGSTIPTEEGEGGTSQLLSPLSAIQLASKCDRATLLRSQSVVVLRGNRSSIAQATQLLRKLISVNQPSTFVIACPEELSRVWISRFDGGTASTSGASQPIPLLREIRSHYSSLLQLSVTPAEKRTRVSPAVDAKVVVSSQDRKEAVEAAQEIASIVQSFRESASE